MCANLPGRDLRERLERDAAALAPPPAPSSVSDADVAALPPVVRRYLRWMGAVGADEVTSFRAHLRCRFRMRPDSAFMPAEIWQYNTVDPIARLFWMRIDMAGGVLPMVGRDSYLGGVGRLRGTLFGAITVADGQGEAFDVGELTTWLNDAVLLAPSMLLRAGAVFTPVDETAFDVTVTDAGRTVTACVRLDGRGAPIDFSSEDRYADLPSGPVRTRWSTPLEGWRVVDGRALPTRGSAVWHLPDGDFTYAVLDFADGSLEPNVVPDAAPAAHGGRPRREVADAAGGAVAILAMTVGSPLLRRRYHRWGATDAECAAPMPGDELVPEPRLKSTRAVTIEAPPEEVWPWLAQIGHGRGGLYSYDALENLVGLDIHSADEVLPEHQGIAPGALVRLGKPGSPGFRVVSVDPARSLVLLSADPTTEHSPATPVRDGTGATWQWTLTGIRGGAATRLVTRQRNTHPRGQAALWRLIEPIGFVMERRMLLGIKERAERQRAGRRGVRGVRGRADG